MVGLFYRHFAMEVSQILFYFQIDIFHGIQWMNSSMVVSGVCIEILDAIATTLNFR